MFISVEILEPVVARNMLNLKDPKATKGQKCRMYQTMTNNRSIIQINHLNNKMWKNNYGIQFFNLLPLLDD